MFAIGRKTKCAETQLIEYSAQSNVLAAPLNADNSTFSENINTNAVFSYREETKNVKLLQN